MAQIHGAGPVAERLARTLATLTKGTDQPAAAGTGVGTGAGLMVWVAPEARAETPEAALQHLYLTPQRLVESFAREVQAAHRDGAGEWQAGGQVLLVVELRLLANGSGWPAHRAATAALLAWVEEAALRFAPDLRLNVLALPLADPPDLRPTLGWLTGRAVVTGQVVRLGLPPPSTAPFRGHPVAKPA